MSYFLINTTHKQRWWHHRAAGRRQVVVGRCAALHCGHSWWRMSLSASPPAMCKPVRLSVPLRLLSNHQSLRIHVGVATTCWLIYPYVRTALPCTQHCLSIRRGALPPQEGHTSFELQIFLNRYFESLSRSKGVPNKLQL